MHPNTTVCNRCTKLTIFPDLVGKNGRLWGESVLCMPVATEGGEATLAMPRWPRADLVSCLDQCFICLYVFCAFVFA
jgi:hypothetical protein